MEIDFSYQIRAKKLDELRYTGTPEVYLETSRSDFKYMIDDSYFFLIGSSFGFGGSFGLGFPSLEWKL